MPTINVRPGGSRPTTLSLTDEYHALLLRLGKERGIRSPGRLLDGALAGLRGKRLQPAAEAWIRQQTVQALPAGDDPRDALIAALTDHIARLEAAVAAQSKQAVAGYRSALLALVAA